MAWCIYYGSLYWVPALHYDYVFNTYLRLAFYDVLSSSILNYTMSQHDGKIILLLHCSTPSHNDEFSFPDFLLDVLEHAVPNPELLGVGGNTGKANSFVGVDIKDLTGGIFMPPIFSTATPSSVLCSRSS